jgi:hypothetical protein
MRLYLSSGYLRPLAGVSSASGAAIDGERDWRDELSGADTERAEDGELNDRGRLPPDCVPRDKFPGYEGLVAGWLEERVTRRRRGLATSLASGDSLPKLEADEPDELSDSTTMASKNGTAKLTQDKASLAEQGEPTEACCGM